MNTLSYARVCVCVCVCERMCVYVLTINNINDIKIVNIVRASHVFVVYIRFVITFENNKSCLLLMLYVCFVIGANTIAVPVQKY